MFKNKNVFEYGTCQWRSAYSRWRVVGYKKYEHLSIRIEFYKCETNLDLMSLYAYCTFNISEISPLTLILYTLNTLLAEIYRSYNERDYCDNMCIYIL